MPAMKTTPSLLQARNTLSILLLLALLVPTVALATAPEIDKAGERCFARVEYPAVDAGIEGQVVDARVYFRADQSEDFFYVKMTRQEGLWVGVLPVPSAETERVVFYVQAVSDSLDDTRSSDYSVPVVEEENDCDEQRIAGLIPEVYDAAGNLVNTLPGFQGVGGVAAAAGGLGAGELIGIAVGGGLAGTAIAEGVDDEDEPDSSPSNP